MLKQLTIITLLLLSFSICSQNRADSLLHELSIVKSDTEEVNIYLALSNKEITPELSVALNWIKRAEAKSTQINYKRGLLKSLSQKGFLFESYGISDSSIVYFYKVLENKLLKTSKDSADLFNKIGVHFIAIEKPDSALHYLNQAYEIHKRIDHRTGLVEVLVNTGNAFYAKGQLDRTMDSFEEAYLQAITIENYPPMAVVLSNYLGIKLMLKKDTTNILESLDLILSHPYVKSHPDMEANVYTNMASYYMNNLADDEKAEEMFIRALNIYKQTDYAIDPVVYNGLGILYMKKKDYKKAINHFHLSLHLKGDRQNRKSSFENMAKSFTELGMVDSSAFYFNKVIQWMGENQKETSEELVLKAQVNLDLVKKESEIARLEDQHKIDVLNQDRNRIMLIAVSIVFILCVIVFALLFNQKKKQSALQQIALKLKNQNLVNLSLQINEKNQILKSFEEKITKSQPSNSSSILYTDVKSTLKKSLKIDDDWQQFELYLNDLHDGFYDTLKKKFPNLTNKELRVCSLSKLRYSLKETAHTLSISTDSVKSARYRIKKKIGLSADQDLADFLNNM